MAGRAGVRGEAVCALSGWKDSSGMGVLMGDLVGEEKQ